MSIRNICCFAILAILADCIIFVQPVLAHPADEYVNHDIRIIFNGDNISIKYKLSLKGMTSLTKWNIFDENADKALQPEEEEKWRYYFLNNIAISVNNESLNLKIVNSTFPDYETLISNLRPDIYLNLKTENVTLKNKNYILFKTNIWKINPGNVSVAIDAPNVKILSQSDDKTITLFSIEENGMNNISNSKIEANPQQSKLVSLLRGKGLILALIFAFLFGMMHAVQPGHGKALVSAYLLGSEGRIRDAVLLGIIVTGVHTFSVIIIAVILWSLSGKLHLENFGPWMTLASGLLVFGIGVQLFKKSLASDHGHSHGHIHQHHTIGHEHHEHFSTDMQISDHNILKNKRSAFFNLLPIGISGGIVPCWDAIVILILAASWGEYAKAVLLLISFSFGLAFVLILVGILVVTAKTFSKRFFEKTTLIQTLPKISAILIIFIGLFLILQGLTLFKIIEIKINILGV